MPHLGALVPDPEAAVHPRRHPRLRRHVPRARLLQAARGVTCLVSLGRLIIQLIPVCLLWSPPLTLFSLAGMETVLTEPSWKVDTLPWSHKNTAQGNWCTTGKFELFYENMVYIKNLISLAYLLQMSVNKFLHNATFVCAK